MTNFTNKQIFELHEYSSVYSQIQKIGKKFYAAKTICENFSDRPVVKDVDIILTKTAIKLLESIQYYRENTSEDIQEIFDWGRSLRSLESLATNQLSKK